MTLEEMEAQLETLDRAISSGVLTIEDEGKRLTYKNTAEQFAARRALQADIARAKGQKTTRSVVMLPQPY